MNNAIMDSLQDVNHAKLSQDMIAKQMIFLKNQNAILSAMMASGPQKSSVILTAIQLAATNARLLMVMTAKKMQMASQPVSMSAMMASGPQKSSVILTVTLKVVPDVLFLLFMIVPISWARLLFAS